jgi:hypothetical protein
MGRSSWRLLRNKSPNHLSIEQLYVPNFYSIICVFLFFVVVFFTFFSCCLVWYVFHLFHLKGNTAICEKQHKKQIHVSACAFFRVLSLLCSIP